MRRSIIYAMLALVLAQGNAASGAAVDVVDCLTFKCGSDVYNGPSPEPYPIGIDKVLEIKCDNSKLLGKVLTATGTLPEGDPLAERIKLLTVGIEQLLAAQGKLALVRTSLFRFRVAEAEVKAAKDEDKKRAAEAKLNAVEKELVKARNDLHVAGTEALKTIAPSETSDPKLYEELRRTVLVDYDAMAQVLQKSLQTLDKELAARASKELGLKVLMTADLVDSQGRQIGLHLDDYDSIATRAPVRFGRFQPTLDNRTLSELEAASKIQPAVNKLLDGTYSSEIRTALSELGTALGEIKLTLDTTALEKDLGSLALELQGDAKQVDLLAEVQSTRTFLASLSGTPQLTGTTDAQKLIEVSNLVLARADSIRKAGSDFPAQLASLADKIGKLGDEYKTKSDTVTAIEAAEKKFEGSKAALQTACDRIQQIGRSLGLTGSVAAAVSDVDVTSRQALTVGSGVSLDTRFDPEEQVTELRPDDRVVIRTIVSRNKPSSPGQFETIAEDSQSFRLEKIGWYSETRGALLMVSPRNAIQRDVKWTTVPGVAYTWRYSTRTSRFWSDGVSPGLSLSLLDFDDNKDFELGIAFNLSVLKDVFWVGYGRNIQAEANYFYVGVNPLVLGSLFGR